MGDLVWSDPIPWIDGFSYGAVVKNDDLYSYLNSVKVINKKPKYVSGRGCSVLYGQDCTKNFCDINNIDLILRSHQCVDDGFRKNHWRTYTMHSVPHYSGLAENSASIALIDCDDQSYMNVQIINCDDDNKKWSRMKDIQQIIHKNIRANWENDPNIPSQASTYKQYFRGLHERKRG